MSMMNTYTILPFILSNGINIQKYSSSVACETIIPTIPFLGICLLNRRFETLFTTEVISEFIFSVCTSRSFWFDFIAWYSPWYVKKGFYMVMYLCAGSFKYHSQCKKGRVSLYLMQISMIYPLHSYTQ